MDERSGHVLSALRPADQDVARHAQGFERVMQVARPRFGRVVVCGIRRQRFPSWRAGGEPFKCAPIRYLAGIGWTAFS